MLEKLFLTSSVGSAGNVLDELGSCADLGRVTAFTEKSSYYSDMPDLGVPL